MWTGGRGDGIAVGHRGDLWGYGWGIEGMGRETAAHLSPSTDKQPNTNTCFFLDTKVGRL